MSEQLETNIETVNRWGQSLHDTVHAMTGISVIEQPVPMGAVQEVARRSYFNADETVATGRLDAAEVEAMRERAEEEDYESPVAFDGVLTEDQVDDLRYARDLLGLGFGIMGAFPDIRLAELVCIMIGLVTANRGRSISALADDLNLAWPEPTDSELADVGFESNGTG